jgi:hypothetical protein
LGTTTILKNILLLCLILTLTIPTTLATFNQGDATEDCTNWTFAPGGYQCSGINDHNYNAPAANRIYGYYAQGLRTGDFVTLTFPTPVAFKYIGYTGYQDAAAAAYPSVVDLIIDDVIVDSFNYTGLGLLDRNVSIGTITGTVFKLQIDLLNQTGDAGVLIIEIEISAEPINLTVQLLNPPDASFTNDDPVQFTYNVLSENNATNCSLLINNATTQTSPINQPDGEYNFNESLADADYNWTVSCVEGNQTHTPTERTLTVDVTMPAWVLNGGNFFLFNNATSIDRISEGNIHNLDVTVDNIALNNSNVTIRYPNTTIFYQDARTDLNTTVENFTAALDFTGAPEGIYTVALEANDDGGNTIIQNHTFEIDDQTLIPIVVNTLATLVILLFTIAVLLSVFEESIPTSNDTVQKVITATYAVLATALIVLLLINLI